MQLSFIGVVALVELVTIVYAKGPVREWDCTHTPQSCNNACFAVACAGKSWELQHDLRKGQDDKNRALSGASVKPCEDLTKYKVFNRQDPDFLIADEYPFASSKQGGEGAILRCTTEDDSNNQAKQVAALFKDIKQDEWINVRLTHVDDNASPFCAGWINDPKKEAKTVCDNRAGFEFKLDKPASGNTPNTYKPCPDYVGKSRRDLGGLVARAAALAAGLEKEAHTAVNETAASVEPVY